MRKAVGTAASSHPVEIIDEIDFYHVSDQEA